MRFEFAPKQGLVRVRALAVLLSCTLSLAGCGGGSSARAPDPPDPPAPVVPSVSIADAAIEEGNSGTATLDFVVSLSASTTNEVRVDYSTEDGSATAADDYEAATGTIVVAPGSTQGLVSVTVNGDTDEEPDETLSIRLSNARNATIGTISATGTISNDDFPSNVAGLDARPDNQTCVAPPRPQTDASVAVVDAFPSLPNAALPTKMLLEPVADPRWFVLQKGGQVVTFDPDAATALTEFLDLTQTRSINASSEGGLLGMAFHPDYPATPEIFLSFTINHSGPSMRSVISRFILDDVLSPGAGTVEEVILQVDQDFNNHNGGDIAFGPDGFLYIGLGDGGSGGDPNNRAQDTTYLLGSMLRIDVLGAASPYGIPADNPFAANPPCGPGNNMQDCPEIYAWGLRNPWRWTFDDVTGELWLADVGQGSWEEVNRIELGGNYGWRCREGAHDFNTSGCTTGYIDPISEYSHSRGQSITGGGVYRGSALPELIGRYVFGDYASGRIWALEPDGQGGYTNDQLIDSDFRPTSFAADAAGELYFTDIGSARLRKLVEAGPPQPDTIPNLLSETGCTDAADVTAPYSGLIPYDLNAPFWSDGAAKERFMGLPNGEFIVRGGDGDWDFPAGTVIVKNFRLGDRLVETRHLMRHPDGTWAGYTYAWNEQQTEATRVRGGRSESIDGQTWIYPSEGQCLECHTSAAGFSLGPEDAQLNGLFTYPQTGRTANQVYTLNDIQAFSSPLAGSVDDLPVMPDPADTSAPLGERARAYLHTNCSQCHRPGAPNPAAMDLRYTTPLSGTNACDVLPLLGRLGIANARLIAPGDAARSLVVERAGRRDVHGMPPIGSAVIDANGVSLLTSWVNSLTGCQ